MPTDSPEPRDSKDQRPSPSPQELGQRIKMLRFSRGLTLKDLEQRGKISATHVSEIERGKASPTVGALARLAKALGVRPATLVGPRTLPDLAVTRREERDGQVVRWNAAEAQSVVGPILGSCLGATLLTLPIAREPALTHHHPGEEWATVLSGQAEIVIEGETHVLREGDAIHFRADRSHAYRNPSSAPTVLLVASRPALTI